MSSGASDPDPLPANKRAGLNVETAGVQRVPELGLVPDEIAPHHDAIATATIDPTEDLPMVGICLLERGTVVEIKSAQIRYADGQRGRFYIRPKQHAALLGDAGVYLFAVCDRDDREILAMKIVPATVVDDVLGDDPWIDGGDGRSDYAQLSWSRLFSPSEVEDSS